MLVETLATALGVHVLRHHSSLEPASISLPAARGALDPRRLPRVTEFIEAHLGEGLTIEALASEACLSPFHFARAFKAATGTAPHRYLTDRRIGRARALIAEGRLPLAEIAEECGFSSQPHFTRWFKRIVGITPGAYRGKRIGAERPELVLQGLGCRGVVFRNAVDIGACASSIACSCGIVGRKSSRASLTLARNHASCASGSAVRPAGKPPSATMRVKRMRTASERVSPTVASVAAASDLRASSTLT